MIRSVNPHDPSDGVGEFEESGNNGVEQAVARARKAFPGWREQTASARGSALAQIAADLEERSEELARLVVREVGKPIVGSRGEVARAVPILRSYAQMVLVPDGETYPATQAGDWLIARRHPVGVCALLAARETSSRNPRTEVPDDVEPAVTPSLRLSSG